MVHTDGPCPSPSVLGLSALTGAAQQGYFPLQQTEQRSALQNYYISASVTAGLNRLEAEGSRGGGFTTASAIQVRRCQGNRFL